MSHVGRFLAVIVALVGSASIALAQLTTAPTAREPFILGADIPRVPEGDAAGATHLDGGVRRDAVELLRDHGFTGSGSASSSSPSAATPAAAPARPA